MSDPVVSVVITTYFRNDRLGAAIESALNQDYEPLEVLVIDGSGEANAEPVAEQYDVRYIAQDENRGLHADRALGAMNTKGEYISYLDDDDRFLPGKITKQVNLIETTDDVGVVYCGIVWEDGHVVLPDPEVRGNVLEQALMFQMTPSRPSAMLIDADLLDAIPFTNKHGAEDLGMKIELAQLTAFDFVDEPLVERGAPDGQMGGSLDNVEGRKLIFEKYDDLYQKFPSHVKNTAVAHTYLLEADIHLDNSIWSPSAVFRAAQANYLMSRPPVSFLGFLFASVFGRPGRTVARKAYERFVLSEQHRGGIT